VTCLPNLQDHKKALSPVIASIILIAVVVAVSIAAASWMGSISFNFMEVDQLKVTSHSWALDNSFADLTVKNLGTNTVTVTNIHVNGVDADNVAVVSGTSAIDGGGTAVFRVTQSFSNAKRYEFIVLTSSATKFPLIVTTPASTAAWYDSSFFCRKAITVDNSLNPDNLVNYQILVDVQYDSDMQADFSDLRFTDFDCETPIPYTIESYVESNHALVWVNVPYVSASSSETIYMYYANPSVESVSNPDATFDHYLNFTRDGVTTYGGSSQDVDSDQWEIVDDTTLRMWGNNWKATLKGLTVAGDGTQAICFEYKSVGVQAEINGVGVDTDTGISSGQTYRIYGTQNWGLNDHYGYSGGGDWQSYTLVLDNFGGTFNRIVFVNDADGGQATDVYFRNVRVCQYTVQPPTIDVSAEQTL